MYDKAFVMKRFSRWQLIGLVLTLLWIVISLFSEYNSATNSATTVSDLSYDVCVKALEESKTTDLTNCKVKRLEDYNMWMRNVWTNAFVPAFLPLPFLWLYGFILLNIYRSFTIGSKVVFNLNGFSKLKKSFYYFCYGFCLLTVFVFVVVLMSLYADSKVPFLGDSRVSVRGSGGYVTAQGTWTSNAQSDPLSQILFPQQTSKIVCQLNKRQCVESRAMISHFGGSHLMADLIEYDIKSWTKDSIVFFTDGMCYHEIYTFDLNSKTITGAGIFDNHPTCSNFRHANVTYRLEDGFAVYYKLKREASPWLLKVLFSVFGN